MALALPGRYHSDGKPCPTRRANRRRPVRRLRNGAWSAQRRRAQARHPPSSPDSRRAASSLGLGDADSRAKRMHRLRQRLRSRRRAVVQARPPCPTAARRERPARRSRSAPWRGSTQDASAPSPLPASPCSHPGYDGRRLRLCRFRLVHGLLRVGRVLLRTSRAGAAVYCRTAPKAPVRSGRSRMPTVP